MKRGVAVGILAWAALWPLVHRGLVAAYDVSPWKLAGFAMYTAPTPPLQVVLFGPGRGGEAAERSLSVLDEGGLPERLRQRLDRFRIERHALGRLCRPDELGAALLEARPDLPFVVVAVQRMRLDPWTARMTSTRERFLYER